MNGQDRGGTAVPARTDSLPSQASAHEPLAPPVPELTGRPSTPRRGRGRPGRRQATANAYLFLLPSIIGLIIFIGYPVVTSFYYSFTDWDGMGPATWIGIENYTYLFTVDPTFWPSIRATFYFVALTVPSTLICGFLLALLLNHRYPGVKIFRTIFYLPVVLPGIAVLTLWAYIYEPSYGLANQILERLGLPTSSWIYSETMAMPSIVLIGLWGVGGTMIIFLAGLQNVPQELYEAAKVDGAGPVRRMLSITLPMMTPIILLQVILCLNLAFQAFNQVQVLTQGGPGTSTYLLGYKIFMNAFGTYPQLGLASAEAWIMLLMVVGATALALKTSSAWVYEE
ncbi:carbohydrate ABC transporter permease [Brachybacterium sp. AOP43-C2-M15]|uniref:carbohydrate ABC transporter permease n=1 Tax=Brachybacterium sp. AOP43-C2-M15 TaxID=3457661 RepID=UPI004033EF38